jgi:transposase
MTCASKMFQRHDDSPVKTMLRKPAKSATTWLVFGKIAKLPKPAMMTANETLPDDINALRALIVAERAAHATAVLARDTAIAERSTLTVERDLLNARNIRLENTNARLQEILAEIRRAHFGRKSERITDDQLAFALEDLETSFAKIERHAEKTDPALKAAAAKKPRASRNESFEHLPHEDVVIEPDSKVCPCCNGDLHKIGEDVSKRLDKVPAKVRVIVERRPKYGCRTCEKTGADDVAGIIQAPAPAHLIEGGLPTEAFVADVLVSKHADHMPLYRQSQILARIRVNIERSTLAQWAGAGAAELQPLHDYLIRSLKVSPKLFCDETRCPVLDPGRGKTKTGFMWALARDDRPWGGGPASGSGPPAVAYTYAPGRGGEHAVKLLAGFNGILQVDGYAVYKQLAAPARDGGPVTLAYCWSHLRRKFYAVFIGGNAPIATEALARLKLLYEIEANIRGLPPEVRRNIRQKQSKPIVEALKPWLEASLAKVSKGSKLGKAIRYGLRHWDGLCSFLDDGRIEIDSNTVERSIRGLALTRKNALFAGHDEGAKNWAITASLLETCKLNGVDPLAWLTDVLTKLVNRWPASRIEELMPWSYVKKPA